METILSPGEIVRQIRSGRATGLMRLDALGILKIAGRDAAKFLQSQTTQDVLPLRSGEGCLNALLDRKAHIQAMFSLHMLEGVWWLLTEQSHIPAITEHFDRFAIMDDVVTTDQSGEYRAMLCQGTQAAGLIDALFGEHHNAIRAPYAVFKAEYETHALIVTHQSLTGEDGFIILYSRAAEESFSAYLLQTATTHHIPLVTLQEEALNIMRIEAGLLKYGVDYDAETLLPETGMEKKMVSYSKGCFLGQEIVARVNTYGSLQKWLTGLVFEPLQDFSETVPLPGMLLFMEGKPVGTMKSSAYSPMLDRLIGFATLHREVNLPGKTLDLSISPEPAAVVYRGTVTPLPFLADPASASPPHPCPTVE